jgi:Ca2+/Na+ antiporter
MTKSTRSQKAVEEMAETVMRDTRWDWLRTRRSRIALVALMIVALAANAVAWLLIPLAGIVFVLIAAVLWWALRMSVRVVADLPEEYLDERQNRVRDRAYVEAYRLFAGVTLVAATAALVLFIVASTDDQWTVTLTYGGVMAAFWTFEGLALALPSMVIALRERGE